MHEGKLPWHLLNAVTKKTGAKVKGIIQGPRRGCDAAVVSQTEAATIAQEFYESSAESLLVFKADPVTFPTSNPGEYAVIINENDVATTGALAYGFAATIIVPPATNQKTILEIQNGIHSQCKQRNIAVLGGHTEISAAVKTIVVSGSMIGFVPSDYFVSRDISVGDVLLCIGLVAKEGVGIIASEGYDKLLNFFSEKKLQQFLSLGSDISIAKTAVNLNKKYRPRLMHDATEGGILGAAYETIAVENCGLSMDSSKFPITNETAELCNLLEINPLKLISSGTLLLVTSPEKANKIQKESTAEVPISKIGIIEPKKKGLTLDGEAIPPPEPDQIILALRNLQKEKFTRK
jgi:hydrogenase expression/formation protein HypE